jgi:hypothetical protein
MLAAMRRIGVAPPEFRFGYSDGFHGVPPDSKDVAYMRGYRAGMEANLRGAHGAGAS